MEIMGRKQICMSHSTRQPGPAMHEDSRTISKVKPKIRIIHVFAPKIIKTDVENFRELVQKLTGKQTENGCLKKERKREEPVRDGAGQGQGLSSATMAGEMEMRAGFNSGGFMSGLSEWEGFIQDYSEFPSLPLDGSLIHCFDGTPFSSSVTS